MKAFVDANVFVRFLTGDDPTKAERCADLFDRVERGATSLYTSEAILGEVISVLTSKVLYGYGRGLVVRHLRPLIELRNLHVDHKQTLLAALDRYETTTNLAFEDCLAIEHTIRLGLDGVYTYDRKFDQAHDVNRIEP
jgi:uncharacterized protein